LAHFGHQDGANEPETLHETLISALAKALPTRHSDICVRWDDRTFAVLLPETDLDGAMIVAEGLQYRFVNIDEKLVVEIGISHFDLDNQVEALPAFAETSLAVARDTGGIVVNGRPVSSEELAQPVAQA
jgi:GGDEF domain-containing protein